MKQACLVAAIVLLAASQAMATPVSIPPPPLIVGDHEFVLPEAYWQYNEEVSLVFSGVMLDLSGQFESETGIDPGAGTEAWEVIFGNVHGWLYDGPWNGSASSPQEFILEGLEMRNVYLGYPGEEEFAFGFTATGRGRFVNLPDYSILLSADYGPGFSAVGQDEEGNAILSAGISNLSVRIEYDPVVPEPATISLFGLGALGFLARRRKTSK